LLGGASPRRLTVRLPLPSPEAGDDAVRAYSQADWPGGILQRFRRLRPLIEAGFLDGYSPEVLLLVVGWEGLHGLRGSTQCSTQHGRTLPAVHASQPS
jgi:hypothetical protein